MFQRCLHLSDMTLFPPRPHRLLSTLLLLQLAASPLLADEAVRAKLLALHGQFDADRDKNLSPEEQTLAVAAVKEHYGESWSKRVEQLFQRAQGSEATLSAERWRQVASTFGEAAKPEAVSIPMDDGTRLATDVHLPAGDGPFPAVLLRTPYGRGGQGRQASFLTGLGIAVVVQDMRGRFDSEGENLPFHGCGWAEHRDGADTVAWIRRQSWSDGQVGTAGASAGGITQNLLAAAGPEGLAAQHVSVAIGSLYEAAYIGGAFRKADIENWTTGNRFDSKALALMREHHAYDDYWRRHDSKLKAEAKDVPAVHLGGWFDMFAQGTLDEFTERQHRGGPKARGRQKLVMGPWAHALGRMPVGELTFPDSAMPPNFAPDRWFEHHLLGIDHGIDAEPAVLYYTMGDTSDPDAPGNEWRQADDWPVPAEETAYHFHRDGTLSPEAPEPGAPVEYTFDPADPCPTVGGHNLTLPSGPMDQRPAERRGDVVSFTSEALAEPLEVTGRIKARIFISSSTPDTDLSVRLCDVYPDGKSYLIAEGMLRLRHRRSFEQAEPLVPGRVEEVEVDCWSTSIVFNRGHRLRVSVTSSNYPRFDLNPGTGEPWSEDGEKRKQTNRIACDPAQPSQIVLPVVTR